MGESPVIPAQNAVPPALKYNVGETAQAIEYWLRTIFEGEPPNTGTGWGIIIVEAANFRVADVHGTVKRRFPPAQKG